MSQMMVRTSAYKRTTDKQYSLLTHEMASVSVESRTGKSKQAVKYWNGLTEKLNALGPPYRTIQQWKKVWTDFKRFHSKRGFKSKPKFKKTIKKEPNNYNDIYQDGGEQENILSAEYKAAASSKVADFLRSESEDYEQNSQSMHSAYSNGYEDEYSYPDRHSTQQSETLMPDESPYDSYTYIHDTEEEPSPQTTNHHAASVANPAPPPPLRPSNSHSHLLDQTLYTLQNHMEHQTKLLEHLSHISSTVACLMERQVTAIEQQTEAMRRQATATEHHTFVMNTFVDMIREKMPKANSKTATTTSSNLSNGHL